MKIIKRLLYFFGGLILLGALIFFALCTFLCTDKAQQWIFDKGITILSEKLQTKVKADSLAVNPWKGSVTLFGFYLEDKNKYPMLKIDTLHAGISLPHLIAKEVMIDEVSLIGADATLYKAHSDSAANYQFAIDAFKPKKKHSKGNAEGKKGKFEVLLDVDDLDIERLHIKWDVCDKQRRYVGHPKRGHFDANHINAEMSIHADVKSIRKDSFSIKINDARIHDYASGLKIRQLTAKARVGKKAFSIPDMIINLDNSNIEVADVLGHYEKIPADTIAKKKASIKMKFSPFHVYSDIILKDIAEPFGPALSHFTTPLTLSTQVSGTLDEIRFDDIRISTPDKRLTLTAQGTMTGITLGKGALGLRFRHIDMKARRNVKDEIVMHFAKKVRLKMTKQMKALGDVAYLGSLDIFFHREIFDGVILTPFGNVNTRFTINDDTHFMSGYASTSSLEIGKLMNVSGLGPVNANATFKFNVSKKAKRPATALPKGRLPIGNMNATINKAKFKFLEFNKLHAEIESDGSTASGTIIIPENLVNILVDFDYIQTDKLQSLKVYPSLKGYNGFENKLTRDERRKARALKKEVNEEKKEDREKLKEKRRKMSELSKIARKRLKNELQRLKEELKKHKITRAS